MFINAALLCSSSRRGLFLQLPIPTAQCISSQATVPAAQNLLRCLPIRFIPRNFRSTVRNSAIPWYHYVRMIFASLLVELLTRGLLFSVRGRSHHGRRVLRRARRRRGLRRRPRRRRPPCRGTHHTQILLSAKRLRLYFRQTFFFKKIASDKLISSGWNLFLLAQVFRIKQDYPKFHSQKS